MLTIRFQLWTWTKSGLQMLNRVSCLIVQLLIIILTLRGWICEIKNKLLHVVNF